MLPPRTPELKPEIHHFCSLGVAGEDHGHGRDQIPGVVEEDLGGSLYLKVPNGQSRPNPSGFIVNGVYVVKE
jgi:hypothetical protein